MEGSPELPQQPQVELQMEGGEPIRLNWKNCVIRTYKQSFANHLEYTDAEGNMFGIILGQAMMDRLFELEFPMLFSPVLDKATLEWFVQNQTDSLDDELQNL